MDQFTNNETAQLCGARYPRLLLISIWRYLKNKRFSCRPKIWKRYVDDTLIILDRDRVDVFLQHLNSQQPSTCFTMEIENDSFTTCVYGKPTHTDQYLAYDSHHPQSVKRGTVKCLYDRGKRLMSKPSVIAGENMETSVICTYLVLMDIPPLLCRRSQRQEQPQEESPWQS